jgi:hypothetical protein
MTEPSPATEKWRSFCERVIRYIDRRKSWLHDEPRWTEDAKVALSQEWPLLVSELRVALGMPEVEYPVESLVLGPWSRGFGSTGVEARNPDMVQCNQPDRDSLKC